MKEGMMDLYLLASFFGVMDYSGHGKLAAQLLFLPAFAHLVIRALSRTFGAAVVTLITILFGGVSIVQITMLSAGL